MTRSTIMIYMGVSELNSIIWYIFKYKLAVRYKSNHKATFRNGYASRIKDTLMDLLNTTAM